MTPGDDANTPDDEALYRRLSDDSPNMVVVDALSGVAALRAGRSSLMTTVFRSTAKASCRVGGSLLPMSWFSPATSS